MVRFEFKIALRYEVGMPSDFLFNLHAAQTAYQRVLAERVWSSVPGTPSVFREPHFGNRLMRLSSGVGQLELAYEATVDIRHHLADPATVGEISIDKLPPDVLPYLWPSRYCQSDRMSAVSFREFANMPKGYGRVDAVCQWVRQRTRFLPGTTTTSTTALDTLTDMHGVCRDFAHLTIAICRSLNIPARFVSGIDYGADPALGPVDFHAYVEAYLGDRWYLFDPTGISPVTGLLRIGTGRDAADVSFATLFGSVRSGPPTVSIRAIVDPAQGLIEPVYTDAAVSTSESVVHEPALRLASSATEPLAQFAADRQYA